MTGVLSSSSRKVIQRNAAFLPAYSFMLGLLALTGFMATSCRSSLRNLTSTSPTLRPALILHSFPDWFAGVAFAAIGIGGLVPAAIMSIAASNLFTRNIYMHFIRPNCTPKQEAQNAKVVSLIIKFGALIFIIFLPLQYAIQLQLLGGIWISQTIPSVIAASSGLPLLSRTSMRCSPLTATSSISSAMVCFPSSAKRSTYILIRKCVPASTAAQNSS
jgi:solute:Na+ symporter, SSS family